ncbi:MAG: hypothetical protein K0S32_4323 [Bacteroidetes bacterium]|jgi:hypothetical protein|nr:hypothetical protein [Bacteroidota bacterium]
MSLIKCKVFVVTLFVFFYSSCKSPDEQKVVDAVLNAELLKDSFFINHFHSEIETGHLEYLSDSILEAFDGFNHVYQYKRSGNNEFKTFKEFDVKPHTNDVPRFLKHVMPENFYLVFRGHEIRKYDSVFNPLKTYTYDHVTRFLKKNYRIASENHTPVLWMNDHLIANYNHEGVEFFSEYYKEPSKIRLNFKNDSIVKVECFLEKPTDLIFYDNNFPDSYVLHENKIYQLFGHFDTIYIYDITRKQLSKKHIGNKNYKLPDKYDTRKLVQGDFAGSQKNYVSGFYYSAMFKNENTGRFVIFYTLPTKDKNNEFSSRKTLGAIILDSSLSVKNYISFSQKYVPSCALNIKGKGIALPVFNPDVTDEKTVYHIYNF